MSDPVSFEDWYRRQHPKLTSAVLAMCGDLEMSADVADEAFSRALARWPRVSEMASPEGWVYRTAVNQLRRTMRRSLLERRLIQRATPSADAAIPAWDLDLVSAIAALPERQRLAVALHYIADLDIEVTAEVMGVQPGTVLATVHAARANLRKSLRVTEEEDAP